MKDEKKLLGIIRKGLCEAVNTNRERYDSYREEDNLSALPDKYVFILLGGFQGRTPIDAEMVCQALLASFGPDKFPSMIGTRFFGTSPSYVRVLLAPGGHTHSLYEPFPPGMLCAPFRPHGTFQLSLTDEEILRPYEHPKKQWKIDEIAAQTREVTVAELSELKAFIDSEGYGSDKALALSPLEYATNQEDLQDFLWDIGLDTTCDMEARNQALELLNISPVVRDYTQVVSYFEQLRQDSLYSALSPGLWNFVPSLSLSIVIKTKDERVFSLLSAIFDSEIREDLLVTALRGLRQMNTPESRAKIVDVMENHPDATIRRLAKMQHILLTYVPNFDIQPCL